MDLCSQNILLVLSCHIIISAAAFGMRPELKLREVATKYNIEVKFDEFAGKVIVNTFTH